MASGYSDLSEIRKDNRNYGAHSKPPKINLLNERPRRESLIEQELSSTIMRPTFSSQPYEQQQVGSLQQQVYGQRSQQFNVTNDPYNVASTSISALDDVYRSSTALSSNHGLRSGDLNSYQISEPQPQRSPLVGQCGPGSRTFTTTVETRTQMTGRSVPSYYEDVHRTTLSADAKRDMAYQNQYANQWSRPKQIREPRREPQAKVVKSEQRWVKECLSASSSRPTSRASSTRSVTEADLDEKLTKIMQDADEMVKKPLNSQQIIIESGTKVRPSGVSEQGGSSGLHTAVIQVPRGEVNNKSPLPFSYDNFSTLGVRGNIASVGAAEPDKPYPPIFPSIKRTPSPMGRRG